VPGEVYGFEHGAARRWAELANRLFGMESADAPLPPGFILELDRPEWSFLKRELFWTTGLIAVAANVGNFGRMQVANPTASGRISIVKGMAIVAKATAGQISVSIDGAGIVAGIGACEALDLRVPLNPGATLHPVGTTQAIANNLPAVSGIEIDRFQVAATTDGQSRLTPIIAILKPGDRVEITNRTANELGAFVAWGYERPLTPDELAA